ncbi:MAG: SpoIIE family protein phosphatase [Alphaproteobacteria bacterium]|nr:SpoIIE family protein phosphatase [Alphaproteobacteria bacterium]
MINFLKSWLSRHSLKFKLNVSILTCVCLGFGVMAFIISKQAEPIIKSQIDNIAKRSIEVYTTDFSDLATDAENVILAAKNTLSQINDGDIATMNVVLSSALKTVYNSELNFIDAWVYVFPPDDVSVGTLYMAEDENDDGIIDFKTEKIKNFYDNFPWFKEVPKEEKIYWSEPYQDKTTGNVVVTCLVPFSFLGQKDFNGLVALTVDLSNIQNNINNFSFYEAGKLLLLSRYGTYVTHPNPEVALKMTIFELAKKMNLPELDVVGKELAEGKSGQIEIPYSSVVNGAAIFYYSPIKNINWSFCLVYSKDELLRPIRQFQIIVAAAMLVCMLLLLLIINWISHNSTNQLIVLGNVAEKYGKGDFSEQFDDMPSSTDVERLAKALANMKTNLLEYIHRERVEASDKQKIVSELEIAQNIQESVLAKKYPQNPAFDVATMMIPARQVAGDFYDFFFIDDNKFAIVIADVSGKGIPAALYMMKAITLIKNISKSKRSLDFVFDHVNKQLCEGNDSCMFVTAFMAVIDLLSGTAKYVSAGHNPPLIMNGNKATFMDVKKNIVLGINSDAIFAEEEIKLLPNAHWLLYTDGVTEAENKDAKFYGENRLLKIFEKTKSVPSENLDLILKDIKKFVKNTPQSDDITMLDFVFHGYEAGTITYSARIEKLEEFLLYLKDDMLKYKLSEKAVFNMVMAAEEIFANIAKYAYTSADNPVVTVKTREEGGFYYVKFIDSGRKYNPLKNKMPDVTVDLKQRNIGGLGVFLMKKLTDSATYKWQNKQNMLEVGIKIDK